MASRSQDTEGKKASATAKPDARPRRAREDGGPNLVAAYMREVASVSVLTPEKEQALAQKIVQQRVRLWRAILAYPPFIDSILDLIEAKLGPEVDDGALPATEIEAIRQSSRAFRDRETKQHFEDYDRDRETLAAAMAKIDLDGIASEAFIIDLERIRAGERELNHLDVVHPPRASRPFASYSREIEHASVALADAKNRFVRANLRLVISIARRFDHGLMPLQDLIQEGNIGLMKAVDRFNAELGFRFSTYASWWIRHAINRALANKGRTVRLPAHVSADLQRIGRARREIEARTGSKASAADLAKATDLALPRVQKLLRLALEPTISLDAPVGNEDSRGLVDLLEDSNVDMPGEQLEAAGMNAHLREAMTRLQPIEIDILCKRYGIDSDDEFEPMTLRQLGEIHSLSRERIRQLQERALSKLRIEFSRRDLLVA